MTSIAILDNLFSPMTGSDRDTVFLERHRIGDRLKQATSPIVDFTERQCCDTLFFQFESRKPSRPSGVSLLSLSLRVVVTGSICQITNQMREHYSI
jgi:hypothetical protein